MVDLWLGWGFDNDNYKEYVKELMTAKVTSNNIATYLNQRTGKELSGQDIRNLIKTIKEKDIDKPKAEDILSNITDAGGRVFYSENDKNNVSVLWIQTVGMVRLLEKEKTRFFQNYTIFCEFLKLKKFAMCFLKWHLLLNALLQL